MASSSMPLTPDAGPYAAVRSPGPDAPPTAPSWTAKHWYLGSLALLLSFASLALYYTAAVVYLTPYYWKIDPKLAVWWGVPSEEEEEANPDVDPGHGEMTLPTYLFLGLFVPMLLSMVLMPLLHHFNVRRITGRHVFRVAMFLRRKPFVFGRLSPFGYGELLFLIVFLVGGNIFVSWYQYDAYMGYMEGVELTLDVYLSQIGLLFGYTCVWNMAFLFLPATRNCVWMELLGISYANGVKYHRWCGVTVVVTGVLHTIPYYWMWLRKHTWIDEALPCFDCKIDQKSEGRHVWFNVYGELALLCFLVLSALSLPVVRRRMYESFYYVHHLFIPGVIFTVLHWQTTTWFIFPSFLVYLIDRAVSSSNAFWPVLVREFTVLPDGIIKIVLARSEHDGGEYAIGQFVYLNAPAVSKLQWHPFTIASSPQTSKHSLTILLKSLGDWTQDLATHAETCAAQNATPTLYMDGYYGESLDKYATYPTLCLVAGGIGVTPILAILEDMAATLSRKDNESPRQRVLLVVTFRELSLLELLHPVLSQLRELDPRGDFFTCRLFLTRTPEDAALDRAAHVGTKTLETSAKPAAWSNTAAEAKSTPFAAPLSTRGFKALTLAVVMFIAVYLVAWLEYGNGQIVDGGKESQLWMVQYTVEIAVVFIAPLIVYAAVLLERIFKTRRPAKEETVDSMNYDTSAKLALNHGDGDLHSLRDLVACYDVTVGRRPDMNELLGEIGGDYKRERVVDDVVGVFVSGPEALKEATELAVAALGSHRFDIHAEEFEL